MDVSLAFIQDVFNASTVQNLSISPPHPAGRCWGLPAQVHEGLLSIFPTEQSTPLLGRPSRGMFLVATGRKRGPIFLEDFSLFGQKGLFHVFQNVFFFVWFS